MSAFVSDCRDCFCLEYERGEGGGMALCAKCGCPWYRHKSQAEDAKGLSNASDESNS